MKKLMKILSCLISTAVVGSMFVGCKAKDDPNELTI
ncbi:hypothetical protein BCM20_000126 [Clostridium beijerinckii]|nr:hypothetical protein [Clostridium beijerinckii]NYC00171.1 hypothetical protein [Clostridium beijerinckii]